MPGWLIASARNEKSDRIEIYSCRVIRVDSAAPMPIVEACAKAHPAKRDEATPRAGNLPVEKTGVKPATRAPADLNKRRVTPRFGGPRPQRSD